MSCHDYKGVMIVLCTPHSSKVLPKQVCPSNRPVLKAFTFFPYMMHHFSRLALYGDSITSLMDDRISTLLFLLTTPA